MQDRQLDWLNYIDLKSRVHKVPKHLDRGGVCKQISKQIKK
jgi:hypothetical protein